MAASLVSGTLACLTLGLLIFVVVVVADIFVDCRLSTVG